MVFSPFFYLIINVYAYVGEVFDHYGVVTGGYIPVIHVNVLVSLGLSKDLQKYNHGNNCSNI